MKKKVSMYQAVIFLIMITLALLCILPFALMIVASFSSEISIVRNGYSFTPEGVNLDSYKYLMSTHYNIIKSYVISISVTAIGTSLGLMMTISLAYPLSRRGMPGKNIFSFFVFFTMLFNGGLIPTYIMWTSTFHIKNTYLAYILPNLLVRAYYIMMMRTYFTTNIPEPIIESARIDGASEFKILMRIVLPLAKPILVTVGLLVGIGYWNDWQNGMYYINATGKYSVQVLLNSMLKAALMTAELSPNELAGAVIPTNGVRMACAVMGILPILIVYPFTQKYIVKGITIGGVKG